MALTKVQSEMAGAGQVLQVVNSITTTQVSNSTTTVADTTLSASITPKFSSSKILVLVSQNGLNANTMNLGVTATLLRNSTTLHTITAYSAYSTVSNDWSTSTCYLDSPATTSSITYKTQFVKSVGTAGSVYANADGITSTITLMEIAQ